MYLLEISNGVNSSGCLSVGGYLLVGTAPASWCTIMEQTPSHTVHAQVLLVCVQNTWTCRYEGKPAHTHTHTPALWLVLNTYLLQVNVKCVFAELDLLHQGLLQKLDLKRRRERD